MLFVKNGIPFFMSPKPERRLILPKSAQLCPFIEKRPNACPKVFFFVKPSRGKKYITGELRPPFFKKPPPFFNNP